MADEGRCQTNIEETRLQEKAADSSGGLGFKLGFWDSGLDFGFRFFCFRFGM